MENEVDLLSKTLKDETEEFLTSMNPLNVSIPICLDPLLCLGNVLLPSKYRECEDVKGKNTRYLEVVLGCQFLF